MTATPGSTVRFTLTWAASTPLCMTIWSPNHHMLYTGIGLGTVATTVPNMPPSAEVIVTPIIRGSADATFDLAIMPNP